MFKYSVVILHFTFFAGSPTKTSSTENENKSKKTASIKTGSRSVECKTHTFDKVCCDGVLQPRRGEKTCCCGKESFKPDDWICCEGQIVPRSGMFKKVDCCSCKSPELDIVFALDSSGSITSPNFKIVLDFVTDLVIYSNTVIGPDDVQVGILTYSSSVKIQFHLNDYANKNSLKNAILNIPYTGGTTDTGGGIRQEI
ncbi:collagen alpha-1(XII) chain-like [Mercenaria mercenaria]|uniref:collagen alpha-1(XII) chain-like n=1 Tax=Mercenaria mercenaria TaxID=6596 RepID=UPI00234E3D95|nr:collagen alpha-1(XII) chain-like [Mercenaria mercenaria]